MGGPGSGRPLAPCGTSAAYQRHRKRGEDCKTCRDAAAATARARYKPKSNRRPGARERKFASRNLVWETKISRGTCADCDLQVTAENLVVFDFDHRDPTVKRFAISSMRSSVSFEALREEMSKCDLVCANCHRLRTKKQFDLGVLTGTRLKRESHVPHLFE
jgi:hypothetical protein